MAQSGDQLHARGKVDGRGPQNLAIAADTHGRIWPVATFAATLCSCFPSEADIRRAHFSEQNYEEAFWRLFGQRRAPRHFLSDPWRSNRRPGSPAPHAGLPFRGP